MIGPVFRVLVAIGLFRRLIDRQRLVNTFVSNIRGLADPLIFDGVPVVAAIPKNATAGNVSVAFTALSSAGRLTVSIIVDPDLVTETGLLRTAMEGQLRDVVADEPPLVQAVMSDECAAEAHRVGGVTVRSVNR